MNRKKNLYQKALMDCEEATLLSTKVVYKQKTTLLQRCRLWLHNLTCPPCGHFHSDNQKLEKILEQENNIPQLDYETKTRIQEKIEAEK